MAKWAKRFEVAMERVGMAIDDFPEDGFDLVERRPVMTLVLMAAGIGVVVAGLVTGRDDPANVPVWCNPVLTALLVVGVSTVLWQGEVRRRTERGGGDRD